MQVRDFMTCKVVCVELDDTLNVVKEIFDNTRFHHLLVVDNHKLRGVISDRDLLKAISPNIGLASETERDTATLKKHAHQIMSRNIVTLQPNASLEDVVDVFTCCRISCVPIIDQHGNVEGIVSWRDLLQFVRE
ncbi:MAG: CBS domain-containing protein [Pseudomonadota bacterium]